MPDSHIKMTVMLLVTFIGVRNFRVWSDLGCSQRKEINLNPYKIAEGCA